jgi:hypothetical protein
VNSRVAGYDPCVAFRYIFRIVDYKIAELDPGVGVQGIIFFADADVNCGVDALLAEKPAEGDRASQALQRQGTASRDGREKVRIGLDLPRAGFEAMASVGREALNSGEETVESEQFETGIGHRQDQNSP